MSGMGKLELTGLSPAELEDYISSLGFPAFRARQLYAWLQKGAAFEEMGNLPKALRGLLAEHAVDRPVERMRQRVSSLDGTEKMLFGLGDGHCVEGVLMRYRHGFTLCVSTQVGCRMGCAFCASTLEGLARNLTAAEMLGQLICVNRELGEQRIGNLVLMGSGEPLDNYDHTVRFLRLVSLPEGQGIGLRHISLSTCGLAGPMLRFAEEGLPVTLSVSLHAPNDEIRTRLMPVGRANPIDSVLDACRVYIQKTGRRVIFEYALIDGVNSHPQHASQLADRLRGMQCHVNLIPYNPVPERPFRRADAAQIAAFERVLLKRNISVTVRRRMGGDLTGACGQLRRSVRCTQAAHRGMGGQPLSGQPGGEDAV